jgi:hypothetical protein
MGKTKNENPNHHMGKRTGYDLINGEYHIAPSYIEQFNALYFKEAGIKAMLNAVADHVSEDLKNTAEVRQKIFNDLSEDIGIDLKQQWEYYGNGVLKLREEKKTS